MKQLIKIAQSWVSRLFDRPSSNRQSIGINLLVLMSLKNLQFKKLRTILTIAGVMVGIAAIVFLASLGLGLQQLVTREIVDAESIRTVDVSSPKSTIVRLDRENVNRIERLGHVVKMGRNFTFAGKVVLSTSTADTVVYGMDMNYLQLSNLKLAAGTYITDFNSNQALVNRSLLKVVGINDAKQALGKTMNVTVIRPPKNTNDKNAEPIQATINIVGVVDTGSGAELFMTTGIFEAAQTNVYTQLKALVETQAQVSPLRNQIEGLGFVTSSPIDTLEQINQIFRFFTFILVGFGLTGMVIAILGMLNTLTISLLERTREIALMVSMGARARDIRRLFVIEALLLALGGGVAGIIVSSVLGLAVDIALNGIARARGFSEHISLFITPWWLVITILAFIIVVGLAVVYYPARRAERINPVEALRNE